MTKKNEDPSGDLRHLGMPNQLLIFFLVVSVLELPFHEFHSSHAEFSDIFREQCCFSVDSDTLEFVALQLY